MQTTTPELVRQAIAARIESMPVADAYQHQAGDAWRESEIPLVPEWAPAGRAHLSFGVDDRSTDDLNETFSSLAEAPLIEAPVVVRVNFEVRPDQMRQDWDAAAVAGRHLVRWLLEEGWFDPLSLHSGGTGLIRRTPIATDGGPWLVIEVRMRAVYHMSIEEPE